MRPSIQLSIGFIVFHPLQCVVFLLGYLISRVQSHPDVTTIISQVLILSTGASEEPRLSFIYLQTNTDQKWLRSHVHSQNVFVRNFGLSL